MGISRVESAAVYLEEPEHTERLAASLDLQTVGNGPDSWVVHVLGVHTDGHTWWVQIAPRLDGPESVILKLSRWATAAQALAALAGWHSVGSPYSEIVPVMCLL